MNVKKEEIKAIKNGWGIQYLLDSAYKILGNPIFMFDVNYNMIAFTDVPVDDPIWNEFVTTGTLSVATLEFLASEKITEDIVNADKIITIRREKIKYARMPGHVINRDNIVVGLVTMYECNIPFDADITEAFEALIDKIVIEIRDNDYFTMLTMTYPEDKMNSFLDDAAKNPLLYNPQAQLLYNNFEDYLYVAVVSLERNNLLENVYRSRLEYLKSILKIKYSLFKFSVYGDNIVMLMSSNQKNAYSPSFFSADAGFFRQNELSIGISKSFESIYELNIYHEQAITALKNRGGDNNDTGIFLYDN